MSVTKIPFESSILVVGYGGEGKTTLIERIIRDNATRFKYIICFSPTVELGGKDYQCLGGFTSPNCSADHVEKFFANQRQLAKMYNNGELKEPPEALFIFDDILDSSFNSYGKDKKFWSGKMSVQRHEYLSLIFSVQTLNDVISPKMLSQFKKFFIFNSGVDPDKIRRSLPPMLVSGRAMTSSQFKTMFAKTFNEKYVALYYDKDKRDYNRKIKVKEADPFIIQYCIEDTSQSFL
jgi:GTPase SAR1 family protein